MPKMILIIEDEKPLAKEWERALHAKGYNVKIWSDVSEVISGLDQLKFDLVILDVILPTFNIEDQLITPEDIDYGRTAGVWLCEKLKEKKPNIPVIACTVVRDSDIVERIRKAGVDTVLTKPIDMEELLKSVERFLTNRRAKIES